RLPPTHIGWAPVVCTFALVDLPRPARNAIVFGPGKLRLHYLHVVSKCHRPLLFSHSGSPRSVLRCSKDKTACRDFAPPVATLLYYSWMHTFWPLWIGHKRFHANRERRITQYCS